MSRKVLRLHYEAVCNNCNHSFNIEERMKELETRERNVIPFSAKYSNSTIWCPHCNDTNFRISYVYKNVYRIRCIECGEMFDSLETYNTRCPKCQKGHIIAISQLGA